MTPEKGPSHEPQSASCAHRRHAPVPGGRAAAPITTELPTSTITDATYFDDPSSYRAFLAKVYAGLAVSGQQGPAGDRDIEGIDEGFSQYLRLYWEHAGAPDRRGGDRLGRSGTPGDEHAALGLEQSVRRRHVLSGRLPGRHGERVPAADHRGQAGGAERPARARGRHPDLPGGSQVPPGAELLARDRSLRQHPAGDRGRPDRPHGAAPEHPPGDLRFPGERADRHPG